jgi:6-phosphogluconolactonase/glucosamine-6-phosphate isomerase/deaminase
VALFLVTGAAKREALRQLLAGAPIPAARVHAGRVVVIADLAAAP